MKNFVPLPYRRVAVRQVYFQLTKVALRENLLGREAYRRTEFIVLRRGGECAIARIEKENPDDLFSAITSVDLFALPGECCWTDDADVDVGNPSQLAAKAHALGLGKDRTLIVHGKYEHVNFIYHPDPIVIRVVDVVPPKPAKLWTMAQQVLAFAEGLPAIELELESIDLVGLARAHPAASYLFPCQASGIDVGAPIYFLDTRPEWREWTMIGCERCAQLHRHFYDREPEQVDFCPRKLTGSGNSLPDRSKMLEGAEPDPNWTRTGPRTEVPGLSAPTKELILTKCCLLETTIECQGTRAVVPWGANLRHVEEALRYLVSQETLESREPLAEGTGLGDC
jgi:hypothetical protein